MGINIAAAGSYKKAKQNIHKSCVLWKSFLLSNTHKRGDNITAAGTFYGKLYKQIYVYEKVFFFMNKS